MLDCAMFNETEAAMLQREVTDLEVHRRLKRLETLKNRSTCYTPFKMVGSIVATSSEVVSSSNGVSGVLTMQTRNQSIYFKKPILLA